MFSGIQRHSDSILPASMCRKLKIWIWWICDITTAVCAKFGILLFSMNRKIWSVRVSTMFLYSWRHGGWSDRRNVRRYWNIVKTSREMLCRDLFNLKLIPNSNYQVSGESWSWEMTNNQIPIKYNTLQFLLNTTISRLIAYLWGFLYEQAACVWPQKSTF